MKLTTILGCALSLAMVAGVGAGVAIHSESNAVSAASANHSFYFAIDSDYSADKKIHVETKTGDNASVYNETAALSFNDYYSFEGRTVYQSTFTENYGGANNFWLHIRESDETWIQKFDIVDKLSSDLPNHWGTTDYFENNLFVITLNSDHSCTGCYRVTDYDPITISKYSVVDEGSPVLERTEHFNSGSIYSPKIIQKANKRFDGWYENAACTQEYEDKAISSSTSIYAKYTTVSGFSGSTTIDLRDEDFRSGAAKYAIHYYNETDYETTLDGYSEHLISVSKDQRLVEFTYALDFKPNMMQLYRYSTSVTEESWEANPKANIWNETAGEAIHRFGYVYKYDGYKLSGFELAQVMQGTSGGDMDAIATLSDYQVNHNGYFEMYSETVTLTQGKDFNINVSYPGYWCKSFSWHDSLEDAFTKVGNDLHTNIGGTYSIFFIYQNGDANSAAYITTKDLADADQWAQHFLDGVTCDGGDPGAIITDNWSTLGGTFNTDLSQVAQGYFKDLVSGDPDGNYVEQVVARYDHILRKYGIGTGAGQHTDFMGRFSQGGVNYQALPISPLSEISLDNNTPIILVVVIATVSLTAIGGYLLIKRRKTN